MRATGPIFTKDARITDFPVGVDREKFGTLWPTFGATVGDCPIATNELSKASAIVKVRLMDVGISDRNPHWSRWRAKRYSERTCGSVDAESVVSL
jgi:hypothetical protein